MPLARSQFRLINRGYEETIVLVPGWGTDYRIFDGLRMRANYLVPTVMATKGFSDDLCQALDELGFSQITLMGSSLGGFLAAQFARDYPDRSSGLTLIGIRRRYEHSILEEVGVKIRKNKKAFLHKFYQSCFSPFDTQGYGWFKDKLGADYESAMTEESLLEGLEYLESAVLDTLPADFTTTILHGTLDAVAPFAQAAAIAHTNAARFIPLQDLGHIPFFNSAFQKILDQDIHV